jgi:ArsR family transcriptional regulator, arsenate/arsenite/antimonite-responsive transcriptional repressor
METNTNTHVPKLHKQALAEHTAVELLAALAQGMRLRIFRLLVQAWPDGLPAGQIAQVLDVPASTLSFHLAHLSKVQLVLPLQQGRQVIYRAAFDQVRWLTDFLFENCCGGAACAPGTAPCEPPRLGE